MTDSLSTFRERLYSDWLPVFCNAPHRRYSIDGFKDKSILKLSEFDAYWFLETVDSDLITELNGFFVAPQSRAKEQIFWEGSKNKEPRPITLWIEPIITIGALGRLNKEFGWPIEKLGMQSRTWAFDLVCYDNNSHENLVCEVKKDSKEVIALLDFMKLHCPNDSLEQEPTNPKERNAYRKVAGIRKSWPQVFWALGPQGKDEVFLIRRDGDSQHFYLDSVQQSALKYENA